MPEEVLVHVCHTKDDPKPSRCRCERMIPNERAKKLVAEGLADWEQLYFKGHPPRDDRSQIVLRKRRELPIAKTPQHHFLDIILDATTRGKVDERIKEASARFDLFQETTLRARRLLFHQSEESPLAFVRHKLWSGPQFHAVYEELKSARHAVSDGEEEFFDLCTSIPDDPFRERAILSDGDDQVTDYGQDEGENAGLTASRKEQGYSNEAPYLPGKNVCVTLWCPCGYGRTTVMNFPLDLRVLPGDTLKMSCAKCNEGKSLFKWVTCPVCFGCGGKFESSGTDWSRCFKCHGAGYERKKR